MNTIGRTLQNLFRKDKHSRDKDSVKYEQKPLSIKLEQNIKHVQEVLGSSIDIIIRQFNLAGKKEHPAAIIYTNGLVDVNNLNEVLESLLNNREDGAIQKAIEHAENQIDEIMENVIEVGEVLPVNNVEDFFTKLLSGNAMLLINNSPTALSIGVAGWDNRGVEEPQSQTVVKGPRDGFTENILTNISLVRRRMKTPDLWISSKQVGRVSKTKIAICYIKGIVNDKVVDEVNERLDRIDIDSIIEAGNIEELIQDETYTPFPTIHSSERPDSVAAGLSEGRVAIIVDGSPFVMLVPCLLTELFQSAEDYYQRADIATLLRFLRFFSFFIALLGPSLYIAILTFHQEMVPSELLISIAAQREGLPFPAFVEALLMELTFEVLREAGIRMPRAVGQAMSIVGALVLGTAAVEAGIVSPVMVIVVAMTAIANFVLPMTNLAIAVRMLRFILMFLAASFGLFGIIVGLIFLVLHLCSLRSFGVPYTAPMAPFILQDQKDAIFRLPLWSHFSRPRLISQKNIVRENTSAPADPQDERGKKRR